MDYKEEIKEVSSCCESDFRSDGYVGGIDYGQTCNRCDRKCRIKMIKVKVPVKSKFTLYNPNEH